MRYVIAFREQTKPLPTLRAVLHAHRDHLAIIVRLNTALHMPEPDAFFEKEFLKHVDGLSKNMTNVEAIATQAAEAGHGLLESSVSWTSYQSCGS